MDTEEKDKYKLTPIPWLENYSVKVVTKSTAHGIQELLTAATSDSSACHHKCVIFL
jgi:hypothetical protein